MSTPSSMRPPSVDALLRHAAAQSLIDHFGRALVTDAVRESLARLRANLAAGTARIDPDPAARDVALIEEARARLHADTKPRLAPVFNLTGTVLHTNLGRASLPGEALAEVTATSAGPAALEYDLDTGRRGDRDQHLEPLIRELTGAEAATFVNNNAAAVLLTLNTLAEGREVIVSRGELVEIGGAFRIPDIMRKAGCRLVEVGTTNRTHAADYRQAIGADTALIMKVHASNYAIEGFTNAVPDREVAEIAHDHALPLVNDLGSGNLVDLRQYGLPPEPTVMERLRAGADLVTFSGDKLLGGPQCGLIVGRRDLIERIRQNPLKRALRLDKMTISALFAVLRLYQDPARLRERLPTLRLLTRRPEEILATATRLVEPLREAFGVHAEIAVVDCMSQIGSGALPLDLLPSHAVSIRPAGRNGTHAQLERIAAALRELPNPVIGRVHEGALLLDCRCLEETNAFVGQLAHLAPAAGA